MESTLFFSSHYGHLLTSAIQEKQYPHSPPPFTGEGPAKPGERAPWKFLKLALFLACLPTATMGATGAQSLADIARQAVERAPEVRAARARVDQVRQTLLETRGRGFPRLEAGSAFTRGDGPVYGFSSLLDQRAFGPNHFDIPTLNRPGYLSNFKSYLRAGVPLFTGFELSAARREARLSVAQTEAESGGTRDEVRRRVLETALTALQGRALARALKERIEASENEVAGAQRLRARGLVLGSDYFAAEAVLSGLRAWLVQAEKMAQSAEESLGVFLGSDDPVAVRGTLRSGGPALPPSETLFDFARSHRSELIAARLDVDRARATTDKERSSLFPHVDAMAEAQTNTEDFSSNPSQRILALRAQWAFGDPTYGARRARAKAGVEAAVERTSAVGESVRTEILRETRAYEGALEAIPFLDAAVDQAARSLEAFRPLYQEGRQSILEVLRAEEALARTQSSRLDALNKMHAARVRALAAAGALDEGAVAALSASLEN